MSVKIKKAIIDSIRASRLPGLLKSTKAMKRANPVADLKLSSEKPTKPSIIHSADFTWNGFDGQKAFDSLPPFEIIGGDSIDGALLKLKSLIIADGDGSIKHRLASVEGLLRKEYSLRKCVVAKAELEQLFSAAGNEEMEVVERCRRLLGNVRPLKRSRGLNILCLDGGGMRGLISIRLLRHIQAQLGINDLSSVFDIVCGTSTGSAIASAIVLGTKHLRYETADDLTLILERLYSQIGLGHLSRKPREGLAGILIGQSYYDTAAFEQSLKDLLSEELELLNTGKTALLAIVSCTCESGRYKPFVFRNYELPSLIGDAEIRLSGSSCFKLWEAVRASTAAIGYFKPFQLGNRTFLDGAFVANNPTSFALCESHEIFPDAKINCLVSLGNGKCDNSHASQNVRTTTESSMFTTDTLTAVLSSATDTEVVHRCMAVNEIAAQGRYIRLNPELDEHFSLWENRPEKWKLMGDLVDAWCRSSGKHLLEKIRRSLG